MPAFGAGSQPAQNRAHREDARWARLKGGVYLGSNGWTIEKDNRTGRWNVMDETGTHAQEFQAHGKTYRFSHPSLTWAKHAADGLIAEREAATTS